MPANTSSELTLTPSDGSTAYYSLLYSDDISRSRYMQTLQLIQTISTTLHDVNEPQVAEQKVHWWHEELARMARQAAAHPACTATQSFLHRRDCISACLSILSAAANERYTPLATEAELQEQIGEDYKARITLLVHALDHNEDSSAKSVEVDNNIAQALGQWHRLNTLGLRLHNGYSVFSDAKYKQFDLGPESLSLKKPEKMTESSALIKSEIQHARQLLQTGVDNINDHSSSPFNRLLPLHICVHTRLAQLKSWSKHTPDLITGTVVLTPLKKFFVAYRCRRRFNNMQSG